MSSSRRLYYRPEAHETHYTYAYYVYLRFPRHDCVMHNKHYYTCESSTFRYTYIPRSEQMNYYDYKSCDSYRDLDNGQCVRRRRYTKSQRIIKTNIIIIKKITKTYNTYTQTRNLYRLCLCVSKVSTMYTYNTHWTRINDRSSIRVYDKSWCSEFYKSH